MKRFMLIALTLLCNSLFAQNYQPATKIIIGGDAEYPPFEYINSAGLPDGYNVELSRLIAKEMGVEIDFRLGKWSLVRKWLEDGSIDLIQGMAFSSDRAREYHFSAAHTLTWRAIFIRKDSGIIREGDILNLSVAIQQDDVAEEYLQQLGFSGELSRLPSQEIALKLLDAGDFDAVIANYMIAMHTINNMDLDNIKPLPHRIQQREYCYAALDVELIEKVNAALLALEQKGELNRLHNKWFDDHNTMWRTHKASFYRYIYIALLLFLAILILLFALRKQILKQRKLQTDLDLALDAAKLNKSEVKLLEANFRQGPVIVYKLSLDPPLIYYASENVKIWGYTATELIEGRYDIRDLIFSEDRQRVIEESSAQLPGQASQLFYCILAKSQELRWVMDISTVEEDPQTGNLCFLGYMVDITDQKRYEAQLMEAKQSAESANVAKSHFLANMSHEIRTPLNGITGFLQVLMQMEASEEQREIFDIMYSSSRNLLKIINDILDFSKIEAGKMELIPSDFNPRYLVQDLILEFSHQQKKRGVQITADLHPDIPDVIKGDQLRLKQILINLLQNALKFTELGKIEIGAEVYTRSETEVRILFKVLDTGIGIDPVKQKDIFDNYSQADSNITSKYGGTGLGLAIVKRLVEMMHGFIWVESEPNKGSIFFFILPFEVYNELPESPPQAKHPEILVGKPIQAKILLTEDDPVNQMVTRRQLENWGLTVEIAKTGLQACQIYEKHDFDLILMDIQMPVMDGITATQKIRDIQIRTGRQTPIIALTADALVGDRERFLASGMDDYIAKPIEVGDLYRIISDFINDNKVK